MSFFIRQPNNKKFPSKRKHEDNKGKKNKKSKGVSHEEIESEDEELDGVNGAGYESSEEEEETAQDKRLRLAKKYLEEIQREEELRAEANDATPDIAKRLGNDYLESIGRLKKNIADNCTGFDLDNAVTLKHKKQKLPMTCFCLTTDEKFLFSGSKNNVVLKWDLSKSKPCGTIDLQKKAVKNSRPFVVSIAISTDSKYLAIADGSSIIQIWCPNELVHLHNFSGHRDTVTGLVFRKDTHQLYSCSKDRSVKIWSLDEMAYIESLFGHQSQITSIDALSRERAISSGGMDRSVRIWKIAEESQLIFNGHTGLIEIVKLVSEENFLSAGNDGELCVWSTLKKKPTCSFKSSHGENPNGEANWISAISCVLNTDLAVSGSCDGRIRVWKLADNYRKIQSLFDIPLAGFINHLYLTNDGSKLIVAVGQEHRLGRWEKIRDAKNCILIIPLKH